MLGGFPGHGHTGLVFQLQVAVLVPTTVLAQQHFETFAARMADYPIQIEMLSRFRSQGQRTLGAAVLLAAAVAYTVSDEASA